MIRSHSMPFGAEVRTDGPVRFRLWAPRAKKVDVCLEEGSAGELSLSMDPGQAGWFSLTTDSAHSGSRYRFQIDGGIKVPDPASRFQPEDVQGPSLVVNPCSFDWKDDDWRGRPWEEAVIYELHTGAFTPQGTFAAIEERLGYLVDLGITALELMPVSDFPGRRNWGYDGVLPFAPDSRYGRPDDLKRLVQAAHGRGLMIFLDVVYNHFGPEGNYLREYSPQFFTSAHHTPWGDAINFDGPDSGTVREFFIHNAVYWLCEYHFDGLRLDAVHAIADDTNPSFLTELALAIRTRAQDRHVHLVLENDNNTAGYLPRDSKNCARLFNAQWNDDIHHALHVVVTGERDGYYSDYSDQPLHHLGRCLTEGFDFQGQNSAFRNGAARGEPSRELLPSAFVSFLQNHDQVGNRALGERIAQLAHPDALRAAMTILLLSPQPPMLFMGEEFAANTPFLFFCDFAGDLAKAVTEGRRNEFAKFAGFGDAEQRARIPDPNADSTFETSKIRWDQLREPESQTWLAFHQRLLQIRRREILPRLNHFVPGSAGFELLDGDGLMVRWRLKHDSELTLLANLGCEELPHVPSPGGKLLYATSAASPSRTEQERLPAWSAAWFLRS